MDPDIVVSTCSAVLADQVVTVGEKAGILLEAGATTGYPSDTLMSAVMGFVGANTDAAYVLLRCGRRAGEPVGSRYHELCDNS